MPLIRLIPLVTIKLLLNCTILSYCNYIHTHTYIHSSSTVISIFSFLSPRLFSLFPLLSLSVSLVVVHRLLVFWCSVDGQPVDLLTNSRDPLVGWWCENLSEPGFSTLFSLSQTGSSSSCRLGNHFGHPHLDQQQIICWLFWPYHSGTLLQFILFLFHLSAVYRLFSHYVIVHGWSTF